MRIIIVIFFFCALLSAQEVQATAIKICTRNEAIKADTEASSLKDWKALYLSFKKFSHCDDSAVGEGYSAATGRLLSTDWDQIHELVLLTSSNKKFEEFVMFHIDATIPADDLHKIVQDASLNCPLSSKHLCLRIVERFIKPTRKLSHP